MEGSRTDWLIMLDDRESLFDMLNCYFEPDVEFGVLGLSHIASLFFLFTTELLMYIWLCPLSPFIESLDRLGL